MLNFILLTFQTTPLLRRDPGLATVLQVCLHSRVQPLRRLSCKLYYLFNRLVRRVFVDSQKLVGFLYQLHHSIYYSIYMYIRYSLDY